MTTAASLAGYTTPIPILRQSLDGPNPDGSYSYSYETANGIQAQEIGYVNYVGTQTEARAVQQAQGSYTFTAPNGEVVQVNYVANENGFQPQGSHIPQTPPAILKALEYNAAHPEQNNYGAQWNGMNEGIGSVSNLLDDYYNIWAKVGKKGNRIFSFFVRKDLFDCALLKRRSRERRFETRFSRYFFFFNLWLIMFLRFLIFFIRNCEAMQRIIVNKLYIRIFFHLLCWLLNYRRNVSTYAHIILIFVKD